MKRNQFGKYIFALFALISLLFVSCSNIFNEPDTDAKSTLYIRLSDNAVRTIFPDTSIDDFTDFNLTGTKGESSEVQNLGAWATADALADAAVEIDSGEWRLTLSAKKEGKTFSGSTTINVKSGEVNIASFTLSLKGDDRKAFVDITLRFPENAGVTDVYVVFRQLDSCSLDIGEQSTKGSLTASLTNNTFTLKGYVNVSDKDRFEEFQCNFYSNDICIGSYLDTVGLLPGLTSKLDYTIEYLSDLGFTKLESTDKGIEFTLTVPKGVLNVDVYRGLLNSHDYYPIMSKYFSERTTEKTTLSDIDCYDYVNGNSYEYYVLYDWGIRSPCRSVRATKDGLPVPEFTTYPVYERENDSSTGKSTKLKITNTPELDFKGHGEGYSYSINLNYENIYYPEFTSSKKVNDISETTLAPGSNKVVEYSYKIRKENGVLDRIFYIDLDNLTSSYQPPVLQGDPAAVATNEGIKIRVYTTTWSGTVELKRATSAEGPYTTIATSANNISEVDGYFEYLDKYDLVQGTTYYYKVCNSWQSYGGDYFSETSQVTKGSLITITQTPSLSLVGTVLKFNNEGVVTVSDSSLQNARQVWEYTFTRTEEGITYAIVVRKNGNSGNITYQETYREGNYAKSVSGSEYDLLTTSGDFIGYTYNFIGARLLLGGTDDYLEEYTYSKSFTPSEYPTSFKMSNIFATSDGIRLVVSNDDCKSLVLEKSEGDTEHFKKIYTTASWSIDYTDSYDLKAGTTYYYRFVDFEGNVFGGNNGVYSAVSKVTKGSAVEIKTAPVLSKNTDGDLYTLTPGEYQINDTSLKDNDILPVINIIYAISDSSKKLNIHYDKNFNTVSVAVVQTDQVSSYYNSYSNTSIDLYIEELDEKTLTLESAKVSVGNYSLDLPASSCPQTIVEPARIIKLEAKATDHGIELTVKNI